MVNEPSDYLKDAWRDIEPPPIADDLADADLSTRATVAWMRAVWSETPIPTLQLHPVRPTTPIVPLISPLKAAAAFLTFVLGAGTLQEMQHKPGVPPVVAAQPTALAGRLQREWNSFVMPEAPMQASVLPIGAIGASLSAQLSSLALGSGWIAGILPSSAQPSVDLSSVRQELRDTLSRGSYADAIALARPLLDDPKKTPQLHCEALLAMTYASRCLGRHDEAAVYLNRLDQTLASLDVDAKGDLDGAIRAAENEPNVPRTAGSVAWESAEPGEVGINPTILNRHLQLARESGADAILVVAKGKIVSEWYSDDYDVAAPCSFDGGGLLSLLCGALARDGQLPNLGRSIGELVGGFVPDTYDDIQLGHLLAHTAGLPESSAAPNPWQTPLVDVPGKTFRYSLVGMRMLSRVISAVSGTETARLANSRLFVPLGLSQTRFEEEQATGRPVVISSPREMARIGQLILADGKVGDRPLLSTGWVDSIFSPGHVRADSNLLWWLCDQPAGIVSLGPLDNNLYVFPDQDVIVVRAQRAEKKKIVRNYEPEAMSLFSQLSRSE